MTNRNRGNKGTVLIIDDDMREVKYISWLLEQDGYDTDKLETVYMAPKVVGYNDYDCVIIGDTISEKGRRVDSYDLARRITERCENVGAILVSRNLTSTGIKRFFDAGFDSFIRKPISNQYQLLAAVEESTARKMLRSENPEDKKSLGHLDFFLGLIPKIRERAPDERGKNIYVVGLPASGKNQICSMICSRCSDVIPSMSVPLRYTTRELRMDDDEEYLSILSEKEFDKLLDNGEINKFYTYKGHRYSINVPEPIGRDQLIPTGYEGLLASLDDPDALRVFVGVSKRTMRKRMRNRPKDEKRARLHDVDRYINRFSRFFPSDDRTRGTEFDCVLVSDDAQVWDTPLSSRFNALSIGRLIYPYRRDTNPLH